MLPMGTAAAAAAAMVLAAVVGNPFGPQLGPASAHCWQCHTRAHTETSLCAARAARSRIEEVDS